MRFVRFVCLFAILISVLVLAQSGRAPLANQPDALPIAQQRHSSLPPNHFQPPQGTPFAQRGAGTFKATANRRRALSMQGLDFANAVDYGSGGIDPASVAVADVNGDGKPDLIVAKWVCQQQLWKHERHRERAFGQWGWNFPSCCYLQLGRV